jgi:fructan beta-fructosidase
LNDEYLVASTPLNQLNKLAQHSFKFQNVSVNDFDLTSKTGKLVGPAVFKLSSDKLKDFSIALSNSLNQKLLIGFDQGKNEFFIDRTQAGKIDFEKGFGKKHTAPRIARSQNFDLTLVIDNASVELFADNGLTVMTEIFFPDKIFSDIKIQSKEKFNVRSIELSTLQSIYGNKNGRQH